jgi:hypothetical protein
MQLTAGMGNNEILRECMDYFEILRDRHPQRLRTVLKERIELCKEALLTSTATVYLDVYGDDAPESWSVLS